MSNPNKTRARPDYVFSTAGALYFHRPSMEQMALDMATARAKGNAATLHKLLIQMIGYIPASLQDTSP